MFTYTDALSMSLFVHWYVLYMLHIYIGHLYLCFKSVCIFRWHLRYRFDHFHGSANAPYNIDYFVSKYVYMVHVMDTPKREKCNIYEFYVS